MIQFCKNNMQSEIQINEKRYSYTYTLKNVAKTWEVDVARSMNDRNVLIPPLRTAGPILFKAWTDLSCLVPKVRKYIKLEKKTNLD